MSGPLNGLAGIAFGLFMVIQISCVTGGLTGLFAWDAYPTLGPG